MKIGTVLFTYNRSYHTGKVLEALSKNYVMPSMLHIFQDGLKKEEHRSEWEKVNAVIKQVDFCPVTLHISEKSKGCAHSIVSGIDEILDQNDAVIVLEDDCIPSPNFMMYMLQGLEKYKDDKRVYEIGAGSWPVPVKRDQYDVFGTRITWSWGWGTWKDRWSEFAFDNDIIKRMTSTPEGSRVFACWGRECEAMLSDTIAGKLDAWDIYWTLHVQEVKGICVSPYRSLIHNIGFDGSGMHCGNTKSIYDEVEFDDGIKTRFQFPDKMEIKADTLEAFADRYGSYTALNQEVNTKEHIIVYGLGGYFHRFEKLLNEKYYIEACIDKNKSGYYAGKKIYHIEEIRVYQNNCKIIIMLRNPKECEKVIRFLYDNGVDTEKILVGYKLFGDADAILDDMKLQHWEWCRMQPVINNKVVMLIGMYGSHAIQITKALLQETQRTDIVWIADKYTYVKAPAGVRMIQESDWNSYIYEISTAKVWVWDDLSPQGMEKRKEQIYIQVKHWGSITLKKFYLEDLKSSVMNDATVRHIRQDGERMDYLFSGSLLDEESCKRGLNFKGEAVRIGSPRSDILFETGIRDKVLEYYHLPDDVKLCLYVPTFRMKNLEDAESVPVLLDLEAVLKVLNKKQNDDWKMLFRIHPCLKVDWENIECKDNIINAGEYPNSEELVAAADVMITDYSSIMFEAAYANKPVFLYAPDMEEFIEKERGLLIDYDSLPFPTAITSEQLLHNIESFEQVEYTRELNSFMDRYGVHEDGHASERAAKFILSLLENQEG